MKPPIRERDVQNSKCVSCGSTRCARILYGRIPETEQLRDALAAGHVVLGGCLFSKGMPQWRCLDCGQAWGTASDNNTEQKNESSP